MTQKEPCGNQDGDRIRQLRKDAGLSMPALAERVGMHPQSLRNIEEGRKPAGLGMLIRIARELNSRVDALLRDAA
jgi:transcriptional regulator with XRE-family HTH domain